MKLQATGVKGFDEMLGGGLLQSKIVFVCGGPGAGKTILTIQCMIQALNRSEPCVFATLEEPLNGIKENMLNFGWDLSEYEKRGLLKTIDLFMIPEGGTVNARDRDTGDTDRPRCQL